MTPSTDSMSDERALAAVLAEDAKQRAGEHPELNQLADYLAGELTPEVEARVQDHLVACRECTAQLLDLETLSQPETQSEDGVADLAIAAGWREQKSRIADLETARQRQRTMRWVSAVAASFFIATVGLSVHVTQLRQTMAGLQQPEINVPIAYLDSATTRSEDGAVNVEFGPDQRSLLMTLTPTGPEWPDYEVELLSASGSEVWSARGLALSEMGTFRIRLPREFLPAGSYEVRLYGIDGDRREQLQATSLSIQTD